MPEAVRLGDLCDGGCGAPPAPAIEASLDVFINGIQANRQNDAWQIHSIPPPHGRVTVKGSPDVFVNGRGLCRKRDELTCGAKAGEGSPNVFVNEVR